MVIHENGIKKLTAALDAAHPEHEKMLRSIDLFLLANELIFEITSDAQRNDILQTFAQISKISQNESRQKAVMDMLAKHFSASKIDIFFLSLRLRFGETYPDTGLFESISYTLDKDVKEQLSKFLLDNLSVF